MNYIDDTSSLIEEDYNDSAEYHISQYIESIENFISNYGYDRAICNLNNNHSISEIEELICNFLMREASAWNHLEIYGTLKNYPNRTIYACCYEPYGDELICIEVKDDKLYFFDKSIFKNGIRMNDINYFLK